MAPRLELSVQLVAPIHVRRRDVIAIGRGGADAAPGPGGTGSGKFLAAVTRVANPAHVVSGVRVARERDQRTREQEALSIDLQEVERESLVSMRCRAMCTSPPVSRNASLQPLISFGVYLNRGPSGRSCRRWIVELDLGS